MVESKLFWKLLKVTHLHSLSKLVSKIKKAIIDLYQKILKVKDVAGCSVKELHEQLQP